ncbi:MAG: site-specific tyrosine recombinase/integron integrase [archaeon]|jgi:integrase/recombinase XerD
MENNLQDNSTIASNAPTPQASPNIDPTITSPEKTSTSTLTPPTTAPTQQSNPSNSQIPKDNKEKNFVYNNPEFEKLLLEIKQELIVEGYSSKTLKMYLLYTREVLYTINKPVNTIDKRDIVNYLANKRETGCENSTLALIHAAMKYMFKEYLKLNILEEIKIPKKAKSLPKVLTKDEIRLMFQNTKFGRNRLMLQFMYGSGCRVSEVVKMQVNDLNFKERTAAIRGGKGNKDRMIILSKEWIHDVKKYLEKKKIKSESVFSKKNGKAITTDTVQRIVRESAVKAGITKHVTPHSFRHSYATHLLEAGTNIRYIQSLLGHSNLNTTQIYTSVANDQLKKVISPLDKL